jgi:hypothetical protein
MGQAAVMPSFTTAQRSCEAFIFSLLSAYHVSNERVREGLSKKVEFPRQ